MRRREFIKHGMLWLPTMGLVRPPQLRAASGISLVASTKASDTATGVVTTPAIDTTGATLLVLVTEQRGSPGGAGVVTEPYGNSWVTLSFVSNECGMRMYYSYTHGGAPLSVGAGHTFTFSPQGGGSWYSVVDVYAFSGTMTSGDPFDAQNAGTTSEGAPYNQIRPGSVTPTNDNSLIVTGFAHGDISGTPSIDSSFTGLLDEISDQGAAAAYLIQTTKGAVNPLWSKTNNYGANGAVIAVFKPAASGAAGRRPLRIFNQ